MSQRIFVGNLPFSATDERLSDLFSQHGQVVKAEVVKDRYTERSRGFGFVEMSSKDEVSNAIAALNGYELEGRPLTVNEARPRTENGRGSRQSAGFGNSRW